MGIKNKEINKYLINQPEAIPEKPSTAKNYQLTPGTCKDCTIEFNCRGNKENLMDFLRSLGIKECSHGKMYKIAESK